MRIIWLWKRTAFFMGLTWFKAQVVLADNLFRISDIPRGKYITVLPQTELQLELGSDVQLSATDAPQTLKFDALVPKNAGVKKIKLSVFDASQAKAKIIELAMGDPFLYSFRGLSTIRVIAHNANKDRQQNSGVYAFLKLRSDRPITVGR